MTPATLRALAGAIYGAEWQTPLGAALGVSARTVRRWASGSAPVPDSVAAAVTAAREAWRLVEPQIAPIEIALTEGRDEVGRDATAIVAHAIERRGHQVRIVAGITGDDPAQRALDAGRTP